MKPFQYIVISSPSGAGKTTLCKKLVSDSSFGKYSFSVSHTTRIPRENEIHGKDYYFVSKEVFQKMVRDNKFVEHAFVHGNFYGTSIGEIKRLERTECNGIVFDIDYQGARQIKKKFPHALTIFILPPSIKELKKRLKKRGTENKKSFEIRFKNAKKEIKHYRIFDYVIINDNLNKAYENLKTIIMAHRFSVYFAAKFIQNLAIEWKKN